ncbi:hypothetical protein [Kitasatospora sp. NPDC088346]|uniref:hypothetical protein n=1 Tax=Kitasatospora sp. NPDC088346 TaxID=3364073 RepID=UPI0038004E13
MPASTALGTGRRLLAALRATLYTAVTGPERAGPADRTAPPAPWPDGLRRRVNQRTP